MLKHNTPLQRVGLVALFYFYKSLRVVLILFLSGSGWQFAIHIMNSVWNNNTEKTLNILQHRTIFVAHQCVLLHHVNCYSIKWGRKIQILHISTKHMSAQNKTGHKQTPVPIIWINDNTKCCVRRPNHTHLKPSVVWRPLRSLGYKTCSREQE